MQKKAPDISRPVILYAEQVETDPDIGAYLDASRLSVIDIEIDTIMAKQILDHLQRTDGHLIGSIRLRFTGRLIHL